MTVEAAGLLARTDRDVAILDAAFATQGLARYYDGRIDPDFTAVLTGEATLEDVFVPLNVQAPGTVHIAPALAPLDRYGRAMTANAAQEFERQIAGAELTHDVVLIDTPPLAGNQAIAAVTTADSVALVTPDNWRGRDALALMAERLSDVGPGHDTVVATFASDDETAIPEAAAWIPTDYETVPIACPTSDRPSAAMGPGVANALEASLGYPLDLHFEQGSGLSDVIPGA